MVISGIGERFKIISVIVPVFNGEKHIDAVVQCLENQGVIDFEVIFVDDGSTDGSLDKLRSISDNSGLNVKIISQENAGVSAARNAGIRASVGDFICFCDVDDEITDDYLYKMHSAMMSKNIDLVICKYKLIQVDGTELSYSEVETGEVTITDPVSCLRDFLYGRISTGVWSIMVRKEVLIENCLMFAEGYKYSEDLHMVWRVIAKSRMIAYLNKRLYVYKLQEGSATSSFNNERFHGYTLMQNLNGFFLDHAPQFVDEYTKYGAPRLLWSITWQASTYYNYSEFKAFIQDNKVKKEMWKLKTSRERKVAISALMLMVSPYLFRQLALRYGKKYIH
ncbi:glycosyltransferase family A protein [Paenibacillus sp. FSL K6-3166]|uniref:glycosyltransferase family 2 protein n=1 Tax=unclassified Paenibacillus TaxID=185978 RepID=UPI000BA0328F|nr:glycosyltransferase family A protein [Paenibacillus sp. VTT E-133291]OZQ74971.1 hypothetical protein CA598_31295 [Paenibacillus sp. VTT E-133291]